MNQNGVALFICTPIYVTPFMECRSELKDLVSCRPQWLIFTSHFDTKQTVKASYVYKQGPAHIH